MKYQKVLEGRFIDRPNRFIANIEINGKTEVCHVKNTGRCKELLLPGARIWLNKGDTPGRKTDWDLISVESNGQIVNIDSQVPNQVAKDYLQHLFPDAHIRREVTFGDSRFDLVLEKDGQKPTYVEVKGVTLKVGNEARFPDAPTERGAKHLRGLIHAKEQGYGAMLLFVVAMGQVNVVKPNYATDPVFASTIRDAHFAGVEIMAVDCQVTENEIKFRNKLAVNVTD